MKQRWRSEEGSALPLTIFYGMLALALILLVVAATSLYLERKRLFTLADGAALVGAEAFALSDVTVDSGHLSLTLDPAHVATAVSDYLDDAPVGEFDSLALERATSVDGKSATVTLSAWWRPPVVSVFVPEGLRIEVTSVARAVLR